MAARGVLLRAVRRPMFQTSRSVGVSHSVASHRHFTQVEDHEPIRPCVPSFSLSSNLNPVTFFSSSLHRLFSSDAAGISSKVVSVKDDAHFRQAIKQVEGSGSLGVLYFTAQWCGPCKQIAPYIDELSQEFEDVTILKVDVDNLKLEETMQASRIGVVPTFQFYKDGKLIGELTGAVKDKLKDLVVKLRWLLNWPSTLLPLQPQELRFIV